MQRYNTQFGKNGMVCSAHPFATLTGLKVLAAGGNAVDAAIAVAGTTGVVIPPMCGLGGDAFALVWNQNQRRIWGFGGSGVVPEKATLGYYRSLGHSMMPGDGILSVAVPGAVDVYFTMHKQFGTLPISYLWEDAVKYAGAGFPVTNELRHQIDASSDKIRKYPETAEIWMPGGRIPDTGESLVNRDLAASFEKVARDGPRVLYQGEIAERLVEYSQKNGGLFEGPEIASQATDVYDPLRTAYRSYEIFETAPPSQGLILLEEMNILEGFDLRSLGPDSPETIHLLVEAKRIAFADRNLYMGDPRSVKAPTDTLISKKYATRRRLNIDSAHTLGDIPEDSPYSVGDTTSFVVVDRWGNAVSFIHSLSNAFGSGVTIPDTGILLNNRAGRGFILKEGHPNCIAGGKKTMHTLNTFMVFRDGEPYLIANTPGGDGQPQHNMQMAVNVLDFGMDPQQAAEAPRWTHSPGTDPVSLGSPMTLAMEARFPEPTVEGLRARGHNVKTVGPWSAGGTFQLILVDRSRGIYLGGTDPRGEGLALGY
ncbi:MAG: gamma-glutamyltransferase [Bacillota bacterium]|nr:gamma-glutamyltransferase [Bacillota bacterium]